MATTPPPTEPNRDSLLLRMLYDEQNRLRSEVEELRRKQEKNQSDEGDKEEGEERDGKEEGKEQDEKNQKDEDKKDNKEQKQPPLRDRLRSWTKAHPVGTILIVVGFIVLVIAAVLLWMYLESYQNTDDAFIDGHTDPISARISGIVVGYT